MKLALSIIALMPLALAPSVQAMVVGQGIHCSELLKVLDSPEERQAKEIAITSLYEKIRSYPEAVLNDIAAERGLDRLLWEKLEQNRRMRHWPSAGPAAQSKKKSDPTQLASAGAKILSGLGFLSLSGSTGLPWVVEPKLKAQYISQIVVGRFGTEPWNAAGSLVLDAIPSNEWPEVQKWLEQPLASDHGFVPAFDPVSQEWGMREPETGLIWFNASQPNVNWEEAKAYCKEKKQALATQEQWVSAEQHRIREVFPEMKTTLSNDFSRFFWSSTPAGDGNAYGFDGYYGYADGLDSRGYRDDNVFARCVSAAPGVRR